MNMLYRFIILLGLLYLSSCTYNVNNSTALMAFQDSLPNASIGFCIKDAETGKLIEEYNSIKSLRPASVLKLVTTATALDYLKSNYKYRTKIGYTGVLTGDILKGDLVIKASGDPTWNSQYFPDEDVIKFIVSNIKQNGIKNISGDFIVDKYGINEDIPRTWIWEDIGNYYGSPSYSINIYDNTYDIEFSSQNAGSDTKIKSVSPFLKDIKFENKVLASKENRDNAWIFGSPYSEKRLIRGNIPENRDSFKIRGSISNPALVFINQLAKRLNEEGIKCEPNLLFKSNVPNTELFEIISPELKEMVYYTNQKSINLYSESIGKRLMLEAGENLGFDCNPTTFFYEYWRAKGLSVEGIELTDLCGLSAFNMVTPYFMTDLLVYMHSKSENRDCFIESLPLAGNSGTLKYFGKGTCLENNLRAKTGSMKGVRSYCGYFRNKSKTFAFSLIVNNCTCEKDKLTELIVSLLKGYCN